jgi:hypothetical protein
MLVTVPHSPADVGELLLILAMILSIDALTGMSSCSLGICGALCSSDIELIGVPATSDGVVPLANICMRVIGCRLYLMALSRPIPALTESKNPSPAARESAELNGQYGWKGAS